jgi:hypothetical protein
VKCVGRHASTQADSAIHFVLVNSRESEIRKLHAIILFTDLVEHIRVWLNARRHARIQKLTDPIRHNQLVVQAQKQIDQAYQPIRRG